MQPARHSDLPSTGLPGTDLPGTGLPEQGEPRGGKPRSWAAPEYRRQGGRGHDRGRPPHRGAVDDQYRHGRRPGHRTPSAGPGGGGLGAGARHGQHRGSGAPDRSHPRAARCRGLPSPADRRFSLQRPPPAHPLSGLCTGPGEIPHQPRQRRFQAQARQPVRDHDRNRHPLRPPGAHRRQLGQPGRRAPDTHDGRQRPSQRAQRRASR